MEQQIKKERAGQFTSELGEELYRELQLARPELGMEVYFAHGKNGRPTAVPHLGERAGHAFSLSFVDIAIAKGRKILILSEIEEESADPKKLIGDICNILLADSINVKQHGEFSFKEGFIIIGLRVKSSDSLKPVKAEAIRKLIISRFPEKEGIKIIVICQMNAFDLTRAVKKKILEIIDELIRPVPLLTV